MNILHNEQFLYVAIKLNNRSRRNFNLLRTCMPKIDQLLYKSLRVYKSKRALNIKALADKVTKRPFLSLSSRSRYIKVKRRLGSAIRNIYVW